nr:flavoprotein [uncultured Bacillus sp.]
MELENLVKNMLKEMLPLLEKRVLIFLCGGSVNADILLKSLADLKYKHFDLVISESGKSMLNEEAVQKLNGRIIETVFALEEAVSNSHLVLIPVMTRNTLAKTALGIADNLVTTGIARAIMMNKEVLAVKDCFDANHPINIANDLSHNSSYNSMLENYENQLQKFGVKFIDLSEFKRVVQKKITFLSSEFNTSNSGNKRSSSKEIAKQNEVHLTSSILTLTDLRGYSENAVIKIKPNTIVTPLAKDFMASHHMRLQSLNE